MDVIEIDAEYQTVADLMFYRATKLDRARILKVRSRSNHLRAIESIRRKTNSGGNRRNIIRRKDRQAAQREGVEVDADNRELPVNCVRRATVARIGSGSCCRVATRYGNILSSGRGPEERIERCLISCGD